MKVALVEDDQALAALEAAVLEHDHDVTVIAGDFAELLTDAPWAGVDVAVVDLMLPGVAGEAIVRYLRDHHPHIRRVVATAKPFHELAELLPDAHTVLLKPFSPDQLREAVGWTA
ncbi:MAG: response regulator [Acidimicrobiia bacterium]